MLTSAEDLALAANELRSMGPHARRLLAECVEKQGVNRVAVSQTALQLESAGFVFVREVRSLFERQYVIAPSIWGEETLQHLDEEHAEGSP